MSDKVVSKVSGLLLCDVWQTLYLDILKLNRKPGQNVIVDLCVKGLVSHGSGGSIEVMV